MKVQITKEISEKILLLEEEYEKVYFDLQHTLKGWARSGAQKGLRRMWEKQVVIAAEQIDRCGDEDEVKKVFGEVMDAVHAFRRPFDGDYGRG